MCVYISCGAQTASEDCTVTTDCRETTTYSRIPRAPRSTRRGGRTWPSIPERPRSLSGCMLYLYIHLDRAGDARERDVKSRYASSLSHSRAYTRSFFCRRYYLLCCRCCCCFVYFSLSLLSFCARAGHFFVSPFAFVPCGCVLYASSWPFSLSRRGACARGIVRDLSLALPLDFKASAPGERKRAGSQRRNPGF